MTRRPFQSGIVFILGALLAVQLGCASSPPTRYYLLSSLPTSSPEKDTLSRERCFSIGVGPINIPTYLNEPNIVTRTTSNELLRAEFDQWAEPLEDNVTRVLSENLSMFLCTKAIVVFPRGRKIPVDYRIEIDVIRFDGTLGKDVVLEVWCRIFSQDSKTMLLSKKLNLSELSNGRDYKSLVAAKSRTLEKLSQEIAEAIKNFQK